MSVDASPQPVTPAATPPPSDRTKVRRLPERGRYDRATIDAILDSALIGHVGYVIDGQPFVTPTSVWRAGRPALLARVVGEPDAARHQGRRARVRDGDPARRARARPVGLRPLHRLPVA